MSSLLVHGTSSKHINSIIKQGLKPRGTKRGEWATKSHANSIYLSQAYALHYAINANKGLSSVCLVEVDISALNPLDLFADEDALGLLYNSNREQLPLEVRDYDLSQLTEWFSHRLLQAKFSGYTYKWSLNMLGNCSHHGAIPHTAITRIVKIKDINKGWWLRFFDPTITLINYKIMGNDYRKSQLVLMDRLDEANKIEESLTQLNMYELEELVAPHREVII